VEKLPLYDVDDAFGLANGIVSRSGLSLSPGTIGKSSSPTSRSSPGSSVSPTTPAAGRSQRSRASDSDSEPPTGSASATAGQSGSSRPKPTSDHASTSSASTAASIGWTSLSPRSTAILRTAAVPLAAGYSPTEIARELGTSVSWVSSRLSELQDELRQSSLPR